MSLQGQEVFSAPGVLVNAINPFSESGPNPIVSTLTVAQTIIANDVDVTNTVISPIMQVQELVHLSSMMAIAIPGVNTLGDLYVFTDGSYRVYSDINIALTATDTVGLSGETAIVHSNNNMEITADGPILFDATQNMTIHSGANMTVNSVGTLTINGTNWAQLVSTVAGLPRA